MANKWPDSVKIESEKHVAISKASLKQIAKR
jgi:hypothetical protein